MPLTSSSFVSSLKKAKQTIGQRDSLTFVLIILAIIGIIGGAILIIRTGYQLPPADPISTPAASQFKNFISAEGIIEPHTDNVQIGTSTPGIVTQVFVKSGEQVKKGTPFFTIDQRTVLADIHIKHTQVTQMEANLKLAKANLKASEDKFMVAQRIQDKRAISQDDYLTRQNAVLVAQSSYETAGEDLKVAQAQLSASQTALNLLTVVAPMDCYILQVNIHPGEYAAQTAITGDYIASPQNTPLLLIGETDKLHVRIDIDENEAWRFQKGAKAVAHLRGNSFIKMDLTFDSVEPQVVPKTSLTGNSAERIDTRVLQVLYTFDPKDLRIYNGQQVDVFIEVPGRT